MTQSILFVCLGNICRSPTADGIAKVKAAEKGLNLVIDSAGTGAWHIGEPPHGPMQRAAKARGYDLSDLRARKVAREDLKRFDLIVAMDGDNLENLRRIAPEEGADLRLLTDYAPDGWDADHVPDPYYTGDFDGVLDLVEACTEALLETLRR